MQLVLLGSSVNWLRKPISGGTPDATLTNQMQKVTSQADLLVSLFSGRIADLTTTARSTDIANTVRMLANPAIVVKKPNVWHTAKVVVN